MMKILHISPSYKPAYCYGGPIQSVSLLCEALSSSEIDIEVLTTTANGKTELDIPINTTVINDGVSTRYFKRLTKDHTHFSPALLRQLYFEIEPGNVVIHIHSWWNLTSLLACLLALLKRVPVVISPRGTLCGYTFNTRNVILKKILHHLLGKYLIRSCHIHCTSQQEKIELKQFQQARRISVIPNLIDVQPSTGKHSHQPEGDCFKMIFLSRIDPKKGLEVLFHALSTFRCSWSLNITGEGIPAYISRLKELANKLNIHQAITWCSAVSAKDKYNLLSQHHLLVLFSKNENFANVILESLIVGTPVAISEQVGLASYVKKHDLGWTSDLKHTSIAAVLHQAYNEVEKRGVIRKTAPQLIREHYNLSQLTQQYINLYQQVHDQY